MPTSPIHLNNFLTPPSTELSPFLMADNQLCIANGVDLGWKKGSITKDLGYSKVGTTLEAGKSITGLHNFRQTSAIQKILATVNNTAGTNLTLQYNNSGTWTVISISTTWDGFEDAKTDFEDFIGYCFIVGYDATDSVFLPNISLTGTTYSTSTNITSMPQAKFIQRYRDRLYIANTRYSSVNYPYRVYFSSVPTAGAITWTPASDFIDVDYSEEITGIGSNWDRLVIFTEFSGYLYDQDTKTKGWDVGCINNRTIQNLDAYLIWANKDNVFASTGGRPTPIGNDIKELLLNADPTVWQSAVVGRQYYIYIGSTEANGIAYTNCMLVFDSELGYWRWRELKDNITALTRYTASSEDFLYLGDTDGMVHVKSKYTDVTPVFTDNGSSITSQWRTKAFDFGDPSVEKTINKVLSYCEFGQGMALRFRIWDKNQEVVMPWTNIGNLRTVINTYDKKITGNFIQFEGKEYSSNKPYQFYGLTANLLIDSAL